jgi:hypothetical protein
MQLATPPESDGFPERWRYAVATALVNPDDEPEWTFLRDCAVNKFDDGWVDAGAIQSLKLTASGHSWEILEEAQQSNQARASLISRALEYVRSNPPPLTDADLKALAERVANLLKLGSWEGNGSPRFNQAGDKALVDFWFQTAEDRLVYTATFHRIEGVWTFRGALETFQAFAPAIPPRTK